MAIDIHVKAGTQAYRVIKDGGFDWDRITTYFAPAGGPKWLLASGFDLSLLTGGYLGNGGPVLLAGSSAGAWRFAAWIQPEAEKSYRNLMDAYISTSYAKHDTPSDVLNSLEKIVNAYVEDDALPFALHHKKYRIAVITARVKGLFASEGRLRQMTGIGLFYLLNLAGRSRLHRLADRVVFYNAPKPPFFALRKSFQGSIIPLSDANFKAAVVASGALPLYVEGVRDIYGAPLGTYRDGGLVDYHLTHRFNEKDDDLTLFFHHQERIIPGWFDKKLTSRAPSGDALENAVMVYPTQEFIGRLPNGKIPDRDDFRTYQNDGSSRMRIWREAAAMAAPLGEQFIELAESGKIKDAVEPL